MKTFILLAAVILLTGSFYTIPTTHSNESIEAPQKGLIAHEWGTFTTLHMSNGQRFDGLQKEEEKLPGFVYQHDVHSMDKDKSHHVYTTGSLVEDGVEQLLPKQPVKDRVHFGKGMQMGIQNVTVKMETPVLYFYSPKKMDIEVDVKFPRGSISQWYPQRTDGDHPAVSTSIDMNDPFNGWINWKATVLEPNSTKKYTAPENELTNTWIAPRNTKSNLVESNGEVEKYLFYRGVANFKIPVNIKFTKLRTMQVSNTGKDPLPYVFVFEKTDDGRMKFWWTGNIDVNGKQEVVLDNASLNEKKYFGEFEDELVKAGLYRDEAKSMLKTWEESYFQKAGFRVFWIVPDNFVDEILPLKITPKPKETKRVFVGRCDVFTPEFEWNIVYKYPAEKFYGHRYEDAIQKRYDQLLSGRN